MLVHSYVAVEGVELTVYKESGYLYGRVSGKISFLTIPSHSQLIHYHDTAVYAPIASCYKELNPFLGARLSAIIVSCSKRNLT